MGQHVLEARASTCLWNLHMSGRVLGAKWWVRRLVRHRTRARAEALQDAAQASEKRIGGGTVVATARHCSCSTSGWLSTAIWLCW